MSAFRDEPGYVHGQSSGVGVLFANLGTPDAPTPAALRRYLAEFLWDPRVIEEPRWKWWLILNLFVLTTRPKESAKLYEKVWTPAGSPLLTGTVELAKRLEAGLRAAVDGPVHVAVGMRYGRPSLATALVELADRGCRKVLVFPLYPQYSGTTTAATFDAVFAELSRWRWMPELRTVSSYHDDPGYVEALAASIRDSWAEHGRSERLMLTFHGIPRRYFEAGDPYYCHCQKTARLVTERLGLAEGDYLVTFQSLFGKEEWIEPYTADTVAALGRAGLRSLDVVCPGFAADCLETLEEIEVQNRGFFEQAGGGRFRYVPALNDRPGHLDFLADLAHRHLQGWVKPPGQYDHEAADRAAREAKERAEALAAREVTATGGFG